MLAGATRVYAISDATAVRLADLAGLDPATVGVLPIPVDLTRFTPLADDAWRTGLDRPTIVFVGDAADPRKNVGLLLEGMSREQLQAGDMVEG